MDKGQALHLLKGTLAEIADVRGYARTDDFSCLREVDAKVREVREVRMIIEGIDCFGKQLLRAEDVLG
jgi:hypothetical protein